LPCVASLSILAFPAPVGATEPSKRIDLRSHGLPLRIDVPACVSVTKPAIKLADNERDLLLVCEGSGLDARVFGVQLGLARGKVGEKEIAAENEFKRWIKKTPTYLEWEVTHGDSTEKEFMMRPRIGGVAYACFNLGALTDGPLRDAELAACRSLVMAR
jgi:hypothetical protein